MGRRNLGLIGCGLLASGVFMPVVSLPITGGMNYWQNSRGDGIVILVLAAVAAGLLFTGRFKATMCTGIAASLVLAFTFLNFQMRLSQIKGEIGANLTRNPFGGLAEMAVQSVQLQWGCAILVAGAACLVASGLRMPNFGHLYSERR